MKKEMNKLRKLKVCGENRCITSYTNADLNVEHWQHDHNIAVRKYTSI